MNIKRFAFSALAFCIIGSAHAAPTVLAGSGDFVPGHDSYSQSFSFLLEQRSLVAARTSGEVAGEVSLFDTRTDLRVDYFWFEAGSGGSDVTLAAGEYRYDLYATNTHEHDAAINFEATAVPTQATDTPPPIAPVPEPGTYAMLLAGLGVLGFMARRRKSV